MYIIMSIKETERIAILEKLKEKQLTQKQAGVLLRLSIRQVRRVRARYTKEGKAGLVHKGRGRISNRAIAQEEKNKAITLIKTYYPDFKPTFAHEKLIQHHQVQFGVDTLRKEMIQQGLWKPKKRKLINIHPYRERRACFGEMIQLDGSPHAWFEKRCAPCTLVIFIDDATSRVVDGMFVEYEGTFPLFAATEHYLNVYGKPLSFYVDKHSTFKINRQASIEEELKDTMAQSQFARAMEDLQITLIFAHSPQAKGRVERLFETLQDRLVKEMRLLHITTKQEGTKYLRTVYIPLHNKKFAVAPREKGNLHRPVLGTDDLFQIFTIQSKRIVSKDLTVQYKNIRYQLKPLNGYRYTVKNAAVTVSENEKGVVTFRYKSIPIPYTIGVRAVIPANTKQVVSAKQFKEQRVVIPRPDHPWRQAFKTMHTGM